MYMHTRVLLNTSYASSYVIVSVALQHTRANQFVPYYPLFYPWNKLVKEHFSPLIIRLFIHTVCARIYCMLLYVYPLLASYIIYYLCWHGTVTKKSIRRKNRSCRTDLGGAGLILAWQHFEKPCHVCICLCLAAEPIYKSIPESFIPLSLYTAITLRTKYSV